MATEAVTLPVEPVTATVALADFCAVPPPNVSDERSALARVIDAWTPPATEPLISPSSVSATTITDSVPAIRAPPVLEAASVGVLVTPSASDVLPPRINASSPSIRASRPVCAAKGALLAGAVGLDQLEGRLRQAGQINQRNFGRTRRISREFRLVRILPPLVIGAALGKSRCRRLPRSCATPRRRRSLLRSRCA